MPERKPEPHKRTEEENEALHRHALYNNGRMLIKNILVEVAITVNQTKVKIGDQQDIREYHIWYVEVYGENVQVQRSPQGNPLITEGQMNAGSCYLTLVDYDGYKVMNQKAMLSLMSIRSATIFPSVSGLVGQCINWTQSYIESFNLIGLPAPNYSFLMEVGYSYFLDWRDDPLSSFAKKI